MRSQQPEEILRANDVCSTVTVVWYAAQQIGCGIPVGIKARGILYRRIKDEMEAQHWTWQHLTAGIDYMKSRGIRPRTFDFVFYHVEPAVHEGFMPRPDINSLDGLDEAIAHAVYMETDEEWSRRLTAARGSARLKVLRMWEQERRPRLETDKG